MQEVERPVLVVCAEKFSDKIGSVRTSRMIFGDGAAAIVVGACRRRATPPDVEVLQTYASGPVEPGELDHLAQPRVRQQHHRLRPRGQGARRALPGPDDGGAPRAAGPRRRLGLLLDAIDLVVPHQANKTMVATMAVAAGPSARRPLLQHREGGQRVRGEHPARDLRRRAGGGHRPADAGVRAGLRRGRGGRLRRHPGRPRRRRSRAGCGPDPMADSEGNAAPSLEDVRAAFGG